MYHTSSQVDVLQSESRKRLQSESDIKKSQEKMVEELHTREQKMLEQVRELKQDKQRLEDTIYRLKTEAMATNVSQQKIKQALEKEREALVS
jgi:biotin operon repressor